jgi:GNAT superfamily N-acetyltransferase
MGTGVGNSVNMPPNSYMLWDTYTDPTARGRGLHKASMRARAQFAIELGASIVLVSVNGDNTPSRKNIEGSGFRYFGAMTRQWRVGRSAIRWIGAPDHPAFRELAGFATECTTR